MHEAEIDSDLRTAQSRWRLLAGGNRLRGSKPKEEDEEPRFRQDCPQASTGSSTSTPAEGVFGFANSLPTNPKPDQPSGDLSDNWIGRLHRPGAERDATRLDNSSQIYGKASVVGERT